MSNRYRVILIRHGKTSQNVRGVYLGCRTDIPLCEEGIAEIAPIKENISRMVESDAFYISSPMIRCRETMALLFDREPQLTPEGLQEMDFGDFEGKNYEDLKDDEYYKKWLESNGEIPFPKGESKEEFSARTVSALMDSIRPECQNIVVAHGGTIMAAMSRIAGGGYFDYQIGNLDGYVLEYSYDSDEDTYNDVSYMRIVNGICH